MNISLCSLSESSIDKALVSKFLKNIKGNELLKLYICLFYTL